VKFFDTFFKENVLLFVCLSAKFSRFLSNESPYLQSKFTLLQSNFFPAKIFFSKIQKKNLAGKKITLQINEVLYLNFRIFPDKPRKSAPSPLPIPTPPPTIIPNKISINSREKKLFNFFSMF
jgi:hypothetical protein